MDELEVVDPTAESGIPGRRRAPRPRGLAGRLIGFLDNGKWNADRLLRELGAALADTHGVRLGPHLSKPRYNHEAPAALIEELAVAGGVVVAIGD